MKRMFNLSFIFLLTLILVSCGGGKKGPAIIKGPTETVIRLGSAFDPMDGIAAIDSAKGDVTKKVTVEGSVDVNKSGIYTLTYTIVGSDGTTNTLIRNITVTELVIYGIDLTLVVQGGGFEPKSGVYAIDPEVGRISFKTPQAPNVENYLELVSAEDIVDTQKLGEYEVVYKVIRKGLPDEKFTRIVKVVDHAIIRGASDTKVEIKTPFNPLQGVTAVEPVAGEEGNWTAKVITERIEVVGEVNTETTGTYELTYKIKEEADPENPDAPVGYMKDKEGNEIVVVRKVEVYISVRILYATNTEISKGTPFDPKEGVEAKDSILGDITDRINITGVVDTNTVGNYKLTYTVTGSEGIEAKVDRTIVVVEPTVSKQVITIMAGDVSEVDPFHENYSGLNQIERQNLQRAVEEKYNVEVKYVLYPSNAAWGPSRVSAIVQASVSGKRLADIYYHVTTDWIRELAQGGAIASIDKYLNNPNASNLDDSITSAGLYNERRYGFGTGKLTLESGLYYNADLVSELGIDNPTQLYLDGEWNWTKFRTWATAAQAALKAKGDDFYALGGVYSYYAQHLLPLNGGQFINENTGRVAFGTNRAIEVYDYVHSLKQLNLFEPARTYDAGSPAWQSGKVLVHPGQLWFIKADNRWGKSIQFELGFVPYPIADTYTGEYKSPIFGPSINLLSSGMTAEREKLAFDVWCEIQRWPTEEELKEEFRMNLINKFEKEIYINAYMSVYDKAYRDLLDALGISGYATNGFLTNINSGIQNGDYRTRIESILPVYQTALDNYNSGS